eukprot:3979957-Pyramimonas_sp.AAC.1
MTACIGNTAANHVNNELVTLCTGVRYTGKPEEIRPQARPASGLHGCGKGKQMHEAEGERAEPTNRCQRRKRELLGTAVDCVAWTCLNLLRGID